MACAIAMRSTRSPRIWPRRDSAKRRSPFVCATGAFRANAIGVRRSRSSTAPHAATCLFLNRTCRSCCRRIACPTAPAIRSRSGAISSRRHARVVPSRRSARPIRWIRSSIRRGTTCATHVPARRRWSTRATSSGIRWISTSAGSATRSCICSMRASGPR